MQDIHSVNIDRPDKLKMLLKYILIILITIPFTHQKNQTEADEFFSNTRQGRILWAYPHPTKSNYLYNDPPPTDQELFDFIIVGSGSAGSALANRLSENPKWRILLLEAGDVATALSEIPSMAPLFQKTKLDWGYIAEKENGSCWGCPNQRMHWPRGRGLGGSSLINFMIHVRGNRLDYDKWEAMGNSGWSYKDILPYFKRLEDANIKISDEQYHQKGGYMSVTDIPYRTEAVQAFVTGVQELGHSYVDYNGKDQIGVSYVQGNIRNGFRWSMEKAYLKPIRNRKNLKILVNSRVTKILINPKDKTAYGVVFVQNRKYYKIMAKQEVILSAGAFNSPQLLMLSGIGPKDHLNDIGIPVIQDLPVGQKMYDHLTFVGLNFLVNKSIIATEKAFYDPANILNLIGHGNGPLTLLGGVEALWYLKTNVSRGEASYPDIEAIFLGSNVAADRGAIFKDTMSISQELYNAYWKPIENQPFFQVLPMLLHPKSHGFLKLKSKNPFQWPKFYPQYYTDVNNEDIKIFIAAIRKIIDIVNTPSLQKYGTRLYDKPMPGCEKYEFNSDNYWECALRTISPTLHHQVATCKMGPVSDPEAVVDNKLKVHGIRNLRVVDTSVIPLPLCAHTHIPSVMIGEKAADLIKEETTINEIAERIDIRRS